MEFLKQYVKDNNLVIKSTGVKKKYFCTICSGILFQPKLGDCLCSYCTNCIQVYFDNGNRKCPNCGQTISLELNIHPDARMASKIQELILECPNLYCDLKFTVNEMEEHLQNCNNKGINCAFNQYGCTRMIHKKDDLKSHLNENIDNHFEMIISAVQECEMSIESIKNNNIENLKKIDNSNNQIIVNTEEIKKVVTNLDNTKKVLDDIIRKFSQSEGKTNELMKALDLNSRELKKLEKENKDLKKSIEENKISAYSTSSNEMENLRKEIKQLQNDMKIGFKMKETGFSTAPEKREISVTFDKLSFRAKMTPHCTEVFSLNGYKFKIRMNISHEGRVFFSIFSMANETVLKWPMPYEITVILLDESKTKIRTRKLDMASSQYKTDYNNPIKTQILFRDGEFGSTLEKLGNRCYIKMTMGLLI